jgi:hypothetical protein
MTEMMRTSDGRAVPMWKGTIWPVRYVELVTLDDPRVQATPAIVQDAVRNLGGLFASTDPVAASSWDLSDSTKSNAFVQAALAVDPGNQASVVALVETYGRLGAGLPPGIGGTPPELFDLYAEIEVGTSQAHGDGVEPFAAVQVALASFQAAVSWLKRLQRRGTKADWEQLIESAEFEFWRLHLTLRWDDRAARPMPAWSVKTPLQVLWATFWNWATGSSEIRRCRHCKTMFQTEDRRKIYCTVLCTNRASAAASYKRRRHPHRKRRKR